MRVVRLGQIVPASAPPETIDTWTCKCGKVHISLHWMKPPTNAKISCADCGDMILIGTTVEASIIYPRELYAVANKEEA